MVARLAHDWNLFTRKEEYRASTPTGAVFGSLIDAYEPLAQKSFPDIEALHCVNIRDDTPVEAYFGVAQNDPVAGKLFKSALTSFVQVSSVEASVAISSFRCVNSTQTHGLFFKHARVDFDFGLERIAVDNSINPYLCFPPRREVCICFERVAAIFRLVGWNVLICFRRVVGNNRIAFGRKVRKGFIYDAYGYDDQQEKREQCHASQQTSERSRQYFP